jgi:AcrR family transcriptional regulator
VSAAAAAGAAGLRERNKRRRVERILEATRELIRAEPGQSPSVERIAAAAEVAPATVFNLLGPRESIWAALADEAIAQMQACVAALPEVSPQERARRIAATMAEILCADAAVYRHVLANWAQSGRLLRGDPTPELAACVAAAQERGEVAAAADPRALAELIATGCVGAVHQWAAGLIDDATLRARSVAVVDLAFGDPPRGRARRSRRDRR